MADNGKASEARKGLIDSVKGKAKEVAGALTDNDSLAAEGQFEQSAAKHRRAANSADAVGEAEAQEARADAIDTSLAGAEARDAVDARTDAVEDAVSAEQAARKQAAEQAGQQVKAGARTRAELDAQGEIEQAKSDEDAEVGAAVADVADAVADHQSAVREAAGAKAEADQLRRQAEAMTEDPERS
ncbi:hypothetical protein OKHIL_53300 [Mycolicibacterium mageritense]|uniref:CsbD family protein n=1 Tax=Mycolicibacterium sp. TaxID=2320850 RepID=UPI0037C5EBD0